MSDLRVVAALGRSSHAPLLAVREDCGFVVLGRPIPDLGTPTPHVVAAVDRIAVDDRAFSVSPYVPGQDVAVLLDAHPEGLPAVWAAAIAADLAEGLVALHAVGLAHGDVRADNARVGMDGVARWVGARGGEPDADWLDLSDLFERVASRPAAIIGAIEARDVGALRALGRRKPVADRHERVPHEWTDRSLGAPIVPPPPPRLVLARISVLVLALGLGMGWTLAPRGGAQVTVSAPDSVGLSMHCGPQNCDVVAEYADGRASGTVDARAAEHYTCSRTAGTLECTASSR